MREVQIHEGMKVVHLGSGAGFYVIPAAKLVGPSGRVVGVDIREQPLETVRHKAKMENLENVDLVRGDLEKPNGSHLPDGWADLVVAANILHQSDTRAVLMEGARLLKPDKGRLLAIEWELSSVPFGPPVENRVSADTLLAASRLCNLVALRRFKPSIYHYAFIFARSFDEE